MSGDVQARKRREKKKKKEDVTEEVVFQHQHQTTTSPNVTEDLNIHVQKEASTGGGLCAKFVFFILLTLLTTLIGLIITEHRGLTDLDTIDAESRFAQVFEGWIDKSPDDHDHESPEQHGIEESEENLSEEEEEDESHADEDDDEDEMSEEKEVDETASDEDEDEDDEEEDEEEESNVQEDDTAETDEISHENEDEETIEESQEEDEEDQDEQEDETQEYPSEVEASDEEPSETSLPTKEDLTQEEEEEEEKEYTAKNRGKDRFKGLKNRYTPRRVIESEYSEEIVDDTKSEEAGSLEDADEIAEKSDDDEPIANASNEEVEREDDDDNDEEDDDDDDNDDDEDDEEPKEKELISKKSTTKARSETPKTEEKTIEEEQQGSDNNAQDETENSNMVVKFGVGTALLVVAHVVLVQKWRTEKAADKKPQVAATEEVENTGPDLTRRNTIVTPPKLEEIEQDIENVEEEYSEDEDYDSEEDSKSKPVNAKMRYQELQSTYSHTLSPEWEPTEDKEKNTRNYEDEDEEDENDEEEQPEGDEDYDDEISENEDEELLRRLEAKYGKIRQSDDEPEEEDDDEELEEEGNEKYDSWKRVKVSPEIVTEDTDSENEQNWPKEHSGAQAVYDFSNITNSDDMKIHEELDQAHQNLANDAAYALTLFNKILERNPSSPRALYGKAQSLDTLAEQRKSNNLLQEAIITYQQALKTEHVPDALFQATAERCIDRMRFRGLYSQAVSIHKLLIEKFPYIAKFANHLAVTYLTINKINEARKILQETLAKWPNDGFALVHYGFILKINDNNLVEGIKYLKKGIETKEPGVIDGRFYFHLGDALTRLAKKEEAMTVYADGVKNKVFLSKYQRSLYNVERLTAKPWWKKEETPYLKLFNNIEKNWMLIRDEGLNILDKRGYFKPESENLRDIGDWKQFELYARGSKNVKNCKNCPVTCNIIESFRDAIECRRGQIKFSVMHPGTHVWPHCGPTNCRLRAHLGLKVPSNTYIRVAEQIRSWEEGKFIIFDDSFEHEVWHNGTTTRLVLIIDFWHPELTAKEKRSLSSI